MLPRCAFALVLVTGCVVQMRSPVAPGPEGGGTLTCAQIVEQCDVHCSDPLCLHRCTSQGNPEGRDRHAALLDCGQRNGCTDEACMQASCPGEIEACTDPAPEEPAAAPPEEPAAAPPEEPAVAP